MKSLAVLAGKKIGQKQWQHLKNEFNIGKKKQIDLI